MRQHIILKSISAALLFFALSGCKQNDALMYENDPRIYFSRGYLAEYKVTQQDSIIHSFYLLESDKMRDTLYVEVSTMGLPENKARAVKLVQTNQGADNAAVAGTHYVAFDDPDISHLMAVPAGQVKVRLPIILIRHEDLGSKKLRIEFSIAMNEFFKPGIDKNLTFLIQTTAMAEQPATWATSWRYLFGTWGPVKMGFIIEKTGFKEFDEISMYDIYSYISFMSTKLTDLLAKYNAENPEYPLCEDVGKLHVGGEACANCINF